MHRLVNSVIGLTFFWLSGCGLGFDAEDAQLRLVFQVDIDESTADREEVLQQVLQTIERRLDHAELTQFVLTVSDDDRIEVLTPDLTESEIEQIQRLVTRPGSLEFSLLANQSDHAVQIAAATSDDPAQDTDSVIWLPVADGNEVDPSNRVEYRERQEGDRLVREFLIIREPPRTRITGDLLTRAFEGTGPNGLPTLDFELNQQGAYLFQQLTARNSPKPGVDYKSRLAIILDGRIHSAPVINEMISGRGQITGDFTEDEVRELGQILNAGSLPVPVEFVESETVESAEE